MSALKSRTMTVVNWVVTIDGLPNGDAADELYSRLDDSLDGRSMSDVVTFHLDETESALIESALESAARPL